jgi:hypothetical protein
MRANGVRIGAGSREGGVMTTETTNVNQTSGPINIRTETRALAKLHLILDTMTPTVRRAAIGWIIDKYYGERLAAIFRSLA